MKLHHFSYITLLKVQHILTYSAHEMYFFPYVHLDSVMSNFKKYFDVCREIDEETSISDVQVSAQYDIVMILEIRFNIKKHCMSLNWSEIVNCFFPFLYH